MWLTMKLKIFTPRSININSKYIVYVSRYVVPGVITNIVSLFVVWMACISLAITWKVKIQFNQNVANYEIDVYRNHTCKFLLEKYPYRIKCSI